MDRLAPGHLTRREWRALAMIALAALLILGAGLAYLRTGGQAGAPTPTPSRPSLLTLNPVTYYFVTPSYGWAIRDPSPDGGFAVFGTTDGAQHWHLQVTRGRNRLAGGLGVPISYRFLDQNHGYIAAGDPFYELLRTSDGGNHWDSALLPHGSYRVERIEFSSLREGWLLVSGQTAMLYTTDDRGSSWRRLADPPADEDTISLRSSNEAWLGTQGVGVPHVYLSTDAGNSWHRVDLPPPPGGRWPGSVPVGVALLPGSGVQVFVPPSFQPDSAAQGFTDTFTSFDDGMTWTSVPQPPGVIAYQDSRHWWAMSRTSLFKSSDAGQSWAMVATDLPVWQYLPHVLDSKNAWAEISLYNAFGLAFTEDGGLHWSRRSVPPDLA